MSTPEAPGVIGPFRGRYHCLSNTWPAEVTIYGWTFPSTEHAFHAMKAIDPPAWWPRFTDPQLHWRDAKRMGRSMPCRADWDAVSPSFMYALNLDKFRRHAGMRAVLLGTGDTPIVELNTWHDQLWGSCTCGAPTCIEPGQNKLGIALVAVRSTLRQEGYAP